MRFSKNVKGQRSSRYAGIIGVILSLAIHVACTPKQHNIQIERDFPTGSSAANVDQSIITDKPCAPPCWYGIKPGESLISETQEAVSRLGFIRRVNPFYGGIMNWQSSVTDWGGGRISFDDEYKVTEIVYFLEFDLTVEDLIAHKGDPESFLIVHEQAGGGQIQIYWPNDGLVAVIPIENLYLPQFATTPPILPSTRIDRVIYVKAPMDLSDLITADRDSYHEWKGYQPLGTP